MKVVINKCFGGFSISPKAIQLIAKWQNRECYFFKTGGDIYEHIPVGIDDVGDNLFIHAYDILNPDEVLPNQRNWHTMSTEDRLKSNEIHNKHSLTSRDFERNDPLLIRAVEELGDEANGECAKLTIVEIPDDVDWEIDEYDGLEHIAEKHRTWG